MSLLLREVSTGRELDRVDLADAGTLTYATGAAEPILATRLERSDLDDAALYQAMAGWSNGYLQLVEVGDDPTATAVPTFHALVRGARERLDARVFKRDRDGKFASGDGGERGIRDVLAAPKTIGELETAAAGEFRRILGQRVGVKLQGLDLEAARAHCEGVARGAEMFPNTDLISVTSYGPGGVRESLGNPKLDTVWGVTESVPGRRGADISFNTRIDAAKMRDVTRRATEGGLVHGDPRDISRTGSHEFTHAAAASLRRGEAEGMAVQKLRQHGGADPYGHLFGAISRYAGSSPDELLGEAGAQVATRGSQASPLARDIVATMQGHWDEWALGSPGRPPANQAQFFGLLAAARNRTYKRGKDGRFSSGGGGAADAQIAALPRVENPADRRAQAMGTNPGYLGPYNGPVTPEIERDGGASYAQNCSRVAIAYEMRRRGIDVTAGAGTPAGDTVAAYVHTFRQDGKYAVRVAQDLSRNMSVREVAAEVQTWPHGARGIVTIQGHTLSVERDAKTGKAVFVDAQAAKNKNPVMTRAQFEARVRSRGAPTDKWAAVARVDDLDLSDYGLHYVQSPSLSIADGHVGRTHLPQDPASDRLSTFEQMAAMTPDDSYP